VQFRTCKRVLGHMESRSPETSKQEAEHDDNEGAARLDDDPDSQQDNGFDETGVDNDQPDALQRKVRPGQQVVQTGVKAIRVKNKPIEDAMITDDAILDREKEVPAVGTDPEYAEERTIEPGSSGQAAEHRTSLDALQEWPQSWTWNAAALVEASKISLPPLEPSSSLSSGNPKTRQLPPGESLEELMIRPQDIPLPRHVRRITVQNPLMRWFTAGPMTKAKRGNKTTQLPLPPASSLPVWGASAYRAKINQLSSRLKTLRNVTATRTRHTWGSRIVFYDRSKSQYQTPTRHEPWRDHTFAPPFREFYDMSRTVPDDCNQRLILVEDLNPPLIDLLGATFDIPPHVFEEHLDRSGYATILRSQRNTPAWQTRSPVQGFSSVTWYRPVIPLISITSKFRTQLIANQAPIARCNLEECRDRVHNMHLCTLKNIWRRHLNLSPEPGVHYKDSRTEFPSGWEERATVWSHDFDGCKFGTYHSKMSLIVISDDSVILLLDPLPTVVDYRTLSRPMQTQAPVDASRIVQNWIPPPPSPPPPPPIPASNLALSGSSGQ